MNALQTDIQTIIRRSGPIRTADICEALEPLGYGGTMTDVSFREYISKTISRMKSEGHVIGEDRPNPGTKPVRYWSLPEPVVNDQLTTEMASDVTEVEQGEWSDAKTFEESPKDKMNAFLLDKLREKADAEWKGLLPSKPMSVDKAISEFREAGFSRDDMAVFMSGIAAAERHHGIAE